MDVFPYHPTEWIDSDGGGFGAHPDTFPGGLDGKFAIAGDGYGDNRDWAPFDADVWDEPADYSLILYGGIFGLLVGALLYTNRNRD